MRHIGRLPSLIDSPLALYDIGVGPLPKREAEILVAQWPHLKVFGCEPHPETFQQRLPDFPGELHQLAIGRTGTRDLHLSTNPANSSLYHVPRMDTGIVTVNCVSLDEFDDLAEHQDRIILWLDIEGAETEALESGPSLLNSGRVICVNVEVRTVPRNPEETHNLESLPKILSRHGFHHALSYLDCGTHHDELWTVRPLRNSGVSVAQ